MKTIILFSTILLIVAFNNSTSSQNYGWVAINPASINGTPDLSDLYFTDDTTGWIISSSLSSNNVFKTTDGGTTFTTQTTTQTLEAIHMVSDTVGYCGGGSGIVFRTTTGGSIWSNLGTIVNTIGDISFPLGGETGYACGLNGAVWRITSAGVTNLNSGLGENFNGISSPSINNVWICGGASIYYYNGINYTEQPSPTGTFNAIYFINDQQGWAVGDQGIIASTKDGGENWVVQATNGSGSSLFDVFFLNENEGWTVGVNGTVMHTLNGSDFGFDTTSSTGWSNVLWNQQAAGLSSAFLRGVHFTSSTNGYVVGNNKTLLKYSQITSTDDVPASDQLMVFPNPTDGIIQLSGLLKENWQLSLLDITGREVFRQEAQAVGGIIRYDISHLKPGVYVIHLKNNEKSITKKIIKH